MYYHRPAWIMRTIVLCSLFIFLAPTALAQNQANRCRTSGIFRAVAREDLAGIRQIVADRPATLEIRHPCHSQTPLMVAAKVGRIKVVALLISLGAKINARDERLGCTPLHHAAYNAHVAVVDLLLAKGADVNAKTTRGGHTPLHLVTWSRRPTQVETATVLLRHRARLEARNSEGATPLMTAVISRNSEMVAFLIKRGAKVNVRSQAWSRPGSTPLHWATRIVNPTIARRLIENGADPNARNKKGDTPLHLAAQHGRFQVVALLIKKGARIGAKNKAGLTPLYLAKTKCPRKASGKACQKTVAVLQSQAGRR